MAGIGSSLPPEHFQNLLPALFGMRIIRVDDRRGCAAGLGGAGGVDAVAHDHFGEEAMAACLMARQGRQLACLDNAVPKLVDLMAVIEAEHLARVGLWHVGDFGDHAGREVGDAPEELRAVRAGLAGFQFGDGFLQIELVKLQLRCLADAGGGFEHEAGERGKAGRDRHNYAIRSQST